MHHRFFRLRPTTRRRFTWLVALLLLWQQLAMAAYACAMVPQASTAMVMQAGAHTMHGACRSMDPPDQDSTSQPLCRAHCHPDHAAQPDGRAGSVPPSALATLPPQWPPLAQAIVFRRGAPAWSPRLRAPPPAASLLFCPLLI